MSSEGATQTSKHDVATRLRELLDEIDRLPPCPRASTLAEYKLALCAEVEALVEHRHLTRARESAPSREPSS